MLYFLNLSKTTRQVEQGDDRMSVHRSLKSSNLMGAKRNVLKRFERVDELKRQGRYQEGQKVWGLPKTKVKE